jgi:hypothetical protein
MIKVEDIVQSVQASDRESDIFGKEFIATEDARLIPGGEPHGLSPVEFRV